MNYTVDDLVGAVRDAVGGLAPNLDTKGYSAAISYPPLRTTLELAGVPLDPFIRPRLGVPPWVAADVYEDYINHYILGNDTPPLIAREWLIRELDLSRADAKWLFPKSCMGFPIHVIYLVRLIWAIGKSSGNPTHISDFSIIIEGMPNVGIDSREILSHWFEGQATLPLELSILDLISVVTETPRLRLRGDNLIRAYHNAALLPPERRDEVRMALRILSAGYKRKVNLALALESPVRRPVGKPYRATLRTVANAIRGFPGNPAPYIVRQLVRTDIVEADALFHALTGLSTYSSRAESHPVEPDMIKSWIRELRKLGG